MGPQSTPFGVTQFENPDNEEDIVWLLVCKPSFILKEEAVKRAYGKEQVEAIENVLSNYSQSTLTDLVNKNGMLKFTLDNKEIVLKHKTHFYINAKDKQQQVDNSIVDSFKETVKAHEKELNKAD